MVIVRSPGLKEALNKVRIEIKGLGIDPEINSSRSAYQDQTTGIISIQHKSSQSAYQKKFPFLLSFEKNTFFSTVKASGLF